MLTVKDLMDELQELIETGMITGDTPFTIYNFHEDEVSFTHPEGRDSVIVYVLKNGDEVVSLHDYVDATND